jgi:hypothetical protein
LRTFDVTVWSFKDVVSGARSITQVNVAERISLEDRYDMALISVRWDQLAGVLPELAANCATPTVLFMINNPSGSTRFRNLMELLELYVSRRH